MPLARWLRSVAATPPTRKSPPARRLSVECLEDRTTPSGGGLLDPSFGNGGVVLANGTPLLPNPGFRGLLDVTALPDGKLLAVGSANNDFVAARYNPDGSPDASFGSGGTVTVDFGGRQDRAHAVAVQPGTGGKVLVAGWSSGEFAVFRLNPGGTLLFTTPLQLSEPGTVDRVQVLPGGGLRHLLPPEVHGSPLDPAGSLCMRHVGLGVLDTLRGIGFADASCWFAWSLEHGYLGAAENVIVAVKGANPEH